MQPMLSSAQIRIYVCSAHKMTGLPNSFLRELWALCFALVSFSAVLTGGVNAYAGVW